MMRSLRPPFLPVPMAGARREPDVKAGIRRTEADELAQPWYAISRAVTIIDWSNAYAEDDYRLDASLNTAYRGIPPPGGASSRIMRRTWSPISCQSRMKYPAWSFANTVARFFS